MTIAKPHSTSAKLNFVIKGMARNHKRLWELVATVRACKYVGIRSCGTSLRPGALQPFGKSNQGMKSGRQYHQAQIEVFRKSAIARCCTSFGIFMQQAVWWRGEWRC